jgi:RNA polymerase sigma factor (sigma-70 family)
MAQGPLSTFLRRLRQLLRANAVVELTDGQLLQQFLETHDAASFEVLVWRHGPMVLDLCRRILQHEQDAEDAFQATFLLLVRKAGLIGKREAVGSWLYKVAYRIALRARATASHRGAREESCVNRIPLQPPHDPETAELLSALDEEVQRLPSRYRAPFVLCYLRGMTNEEAARELDCPKGTVCSRLARARTRLRARMALRGLSLSAGLTVALTATSGKIPAALVTNTLTAAGWVVIGKPLSGAVSASVMALLAGTMHAMFLSKMKGALVVLALTFGLVSGGVATFRGLSDILNPTQQTAMAPRAPRPESFDARRLASPSPAVCTSCPQKRRASEEATPSVGVGSPTGACGYEVCVCSPKGNCIRIIIHTPCDHEGRAEETPVRDMTIFIFISRT